MPYLTIPPHTMSWQSVAYQPRSCHTVPDRYITSHQTISCHAALYNIMSYHVISYPIVSCHIMSCHGMPCLMMSFHPISLLPTMDPNILCNAALHAPVKLSTRNIATPGSPSRCRLPAPRPRDVLPRGLLRRTRSWVGYTAGIP